MKSIVIFVLVIFSAIASVMAQNLIIDGRLTDIDSKKRIADVTITVFDGTKQIFQTTSAASGKYEVSIPVNKNLRVQYTKNGFVTKTMFVNTNGINEEDIPIGGKIFPPIDIDLFINRPNVDFSFLKTEPVVEWNYDSNSQSMSYNEGKMQAMKSKIENLLEKALNDAKKNEANYNQLIFDADKLFIAQNLENALNKYAEAISIPGKAAESHPNNRIIEIDNLLKLKAKKDMLEQQANQAYQNVVDAADKFYDNKEYEKAAAKYKEAQAMNPAEQYPEDMLADIEAIRKAAASKVEYDEFIKSADMFFKQNSLKAAEDKYLKAAKLDPSQEYPKSQLEKIVKKLKEQENILASKKKYDDAITSADAFFQNEKYFEAKQKYEEALTYFSSNPYALNRVGECIRLSKVKNEELSELAYRDVIDEADEFFRLENYDQAKKVYESAISLKPSDAYPKNQLDEIKRILNRSVKEETSLQYLGEEVNISILDGEALFAKSEKQREQDKKQGILRRIFANEKSIEEKSSSDWSERNEYQNEIVFLRDRRASLNVDKNSDKQVLAINLDGEQFSLSKQRLQENNFERASILRQNNEILFILEHFNALHGENNEKHLVNADKLDLIVLDKVDLDRSMTALEEVNRRNTTAELIGISDDVKEDGQRAIDMKKVNDNVVRNLDVNLSAKSDNETFKNYEKLQVLTSDATIAEINRYNSSIEKSLIQFELEEDIALLAGRLQSQKAYREARELQKSALEMDANIFAANEKYKASFADNDLARKETIEDIKVLQAGDAERKIVDNDRKYTELQANTMEIETVKKLNEAKVVTMDDDLLAIREEIVAQEKMITRTYAEKNSSEISKREANVDAIDNVAMNTNKAHSEQSKKPSDNSEGIMNLESALNAGEQSRKDDFTNRKYEANQLLDDMASNKIQFSEAIANTLGDEFPDGVSQQTYLAKDKDGYPQKVTTRRIVVADGRGEVYLRIKTRNAATYSKNGQPITEASWLKGTENANLVRHF